MLKNDDPVGAVSVHGVCGLLGTVMTGLFYGGGWHFVGVQTMGALVTAAWAFGLGFLLIWALHKTIGIRVDTRVEEEGLDVYEHGESAYNI